MSLEGGRDNGGVWGGEDDGGSILVDEVEEDDDDDDEGVGPESAGGGLDGLRPTPLRGCISTDGPVQPDPKILLLAPFPSGTSTAIPFSRSFFPGLRRLLANEDEVGEEADEEVDVVELGLTFFAFSPVELLEVSDPRELRCLPVLLGSLFLFARDSGSEQGLRKGDRLSLSRRNTTAIDPPTTEGPVGPPGPRRSSPNLLEFPVVLLTPSRTNTDTLDCNLVFLPPSFLDLPERLESFLPSLSFPILRPLLMEEDEAGGGRDAVLLEEAERSEVLLVLSLCKDELEDSDWPIFFAPRPGFLLQMVPATFGRRRLGLRVWNMRISGRRK